MNGSVGIYKKKKSNKTDCENYKRITLLTHVGKIYVRIIESRLRRQVEENLGNWQHGFRPGMSTVDVVFALKMLLEKVWEWNQNKYQPFIDLGKAFDRLSRERLWKIMRRIQCHIT